MRLSAFAGANWQAIGELLAACMLSRHPVLVVLTDLQSNFNLYWTEAAGGASAAAAEPAPGIAIAKGVPRALAWKFIRKWLLTISDKSPSYRPDTDHRRGEAGRMRAGFLAFKRAASRPGSAAAAGGAGNAMGDECALLEQLGILEQLPDEERFPAAWDIIRSHCPPNLSYFS